MTKLTKNQKAQQGKIVATKLYPLADALVLVKEFAKAKFDESIDVAVQLGIDAKKSDQVVRGAVVLPNGTGKSVRVAVLADDDDAASAKKAGADIVGNDQLLKDIEKGIINFDILVATPAMMAKLGKYARVLGPKGLMPNPKSGTVTTDVAKAVTASKAGRVEYRVDSTGIVHLGVGKVSFGPAKLLENTQAVFASIKSAKPSSIKGNYVKNITVSTSMGPGIKVAVNEL